MPPSLARHCWDEIAIFSPIPSPVYPVCRIQSTAVFRHFETVPSERTDNRKTPVLSEPKYKGGSRSARTLACGRQDALRHAQRWFCRLGSSPRTAIGTVICEHESLNWRASNPSLTETAIPFPPGPICISTSASCPSFRSANLCSFPFFTILVWSVITKT